MQKTLQIKKTLPYFLEKHYQNSKNTTNITPCRPPVLSELHRPPVLAAIKQKMHQIQLSIRLVYLGDLKSEMPPIS